MATELLDLWPSDLNVDAVSPRMLLNEQAEVLARKTKGLVRGEVSISSEAPNDTEGPVEQLNFDLFAPAVGFRQRLLFLRYGKETLYPVAIMATALRDRGEITGTPTTITEAAANGRYPARFAASPEEVQEVLRIVFNAPTTKATLFSLIARSNEIRAKSEAKEEPSNRNQPSTEG
ncbi:MAG: hypothetical protein U0792_24910 [Gemmataceae bacterium]